jgi:hypothetical protein
MGIRTLFPGGEGGTLRMMGENDPGLAQQIWDLYAEASVPLENIYRHADEYVGFIYNPIMNDLLQEERDLVKNIQDLGLPGYSEQESESERHAYLSQLLKSEIPVKGFVKARYRQEALLGRYTHELENLNLSPEEADRLKVMIDTVNHNREKIMDQFRYLTDERRERYLQRIQKLQAHVESLQSKEQFEQAALYRDEIKRLRGIIRVK